MRYLLFTILLTLYSCSKSSKRFETLTSSELEAKKGLPLKTKLSENNPSIKYYYYNDEFYQLEDDLVKAKTRKPVDDELYLKYWRDKYRDSDFKEYKEQTHSSRTTQYIISSKGITLIYDDIKMRITQVVEYEAL